jgi:ribosomal protein L24
VRSSARCPRIEGRGVRRQRRRTPPQADPANPQGGIERKEAPLHVSKVAIATGDGKPTRVRFEERDGKKVRVAAKTGESDQWLRQEQLRAAPEARL